MCEVMISTTNLTKTYRNTVAVDNVSITVNKGAIVGLIGKNGAGKTTLIRLLTGLTHPTNGTFEVLPNQQRTNTTVAAIVEKPSIYGNLSARDNLVAQCTLIGIVPDSQYLTKTLVLVGLNPTSEQKAGNFSLGMKQRLAIAMTLVGKPQLLILDEPTNGLDPQGIHDMREIFVRLNQELGTTIIISSHILSELGKFATEFFFMDKGKVLKHVTADQLQNQTGKRVRLQVDNAQLAADALSQHGEVTIVAPNVVELSADTPLTQIMLTLAQKEVVVTSVNKVGDALEDFFIELVTDQNGEGGQNNE